MEKRPIAKYDGSLAISPIPARFKKKIVQWGVFFLRTTGYIMMIYSDLRVFHPGLSLYSVAGKANKAH